MKRYRITLDDRTFDVKVLDDPRRDQVRVEVDGETFTVGVEAIPVVLGATAQEAAPPAAPTPVPGTGDSEDAATMVSTPPRGMEGNLVTAPLPGVVKSIEVRPGQQIAAGDALLIIEAMKMDNVIRASREGTIGVVHVAIGQQVAYGEPLLEMSS